MQELARDLAASEDRAGTREIAENLYNREPNIQSDCLKVLHYDELRLPAALALRRGAGDRPFQRLTQR